MGAADKIKLAFCYEMWDRFVNSESYVTRPEKSASGFFHFGHSMHQRQAGSYARRFHYGKPKFTGQVIHDLTSLGQEPGIGLVPPEFDDLDGAEIEQRNELSCKAAVGR